MINPDNPGDIFKEGPSKRRFIPKLTRATARDKYCFEHDLYGSDSEKKLKVEKFIGSQNISDIENLFYFVGICISSNILKSGIVLDEKIVGAIIERLNDVRGNVLSFTDSKGKNQCFTVIREAGETEYSPYYLGDYFVNEINMISKEKDSEKESENSKPEKVKESLLHKAKEFFPEQKVEEEEPAGPSYETNWKEKPSEKEVKNSVLEIIKEYDATVSWADLVDDAEKVDLEKTKAINSLFHLMRTGEAKDSKMIMLPKNMKTIAVSIANSFESACSLIGWTVLYGGDEITSFSHSESFSGDQEKATICYQSIKEGSKEKSAIDDLITLSYSIVNVIGERMKRFASSRSAARYVNKIETVIGLEQIKGMKLKDSLALTGDILDFRKVMATRISSLMSISSSEKLISAFETMLKAIFRFVLEKGTKEAKDLIEKDLKEGIYGLQAVAHNFLRKGIKREKVKKPDPKNPKKWITDDVLRNVVTMPRIHANDLYNEEENKCIKEANKAFDDIEECFKERYGILFKRTPIEKMVESVQGLVENLYANSELVNSIGRQRSNKVRLEAARLESQRPKTEQIRNESNNTLKLSQDSWSKAAETLMADSKERQNFVTAMAKFTQQDWTVPKMDDLLRLGKSDYKVTDDSMLLFDERLERENF